jgi:hypothetical protein
MKGVRRFGKKGKLAPRYVGPFWISERVRPFSYRLELLQILSSVQDIFCISMLMKHLRDKDQQQVSDLADLDLQSDTPTVEQERHRGNFVGARGGYAQGFSRLLRGIGALQFEFISSCLLFYRLLFKKMVYSYP